MSEKALAAGSACPPLKDGTLRLYSNRFCPFAERTRLVLAHHNIPHDVVNVNLKEKPEWFFKKNPLALVPVLEKGDKTIYESSICDEYLDEVYGKQSLLTTDPFERARQKILVERFSKVISPFYVIPRQTGDERAQAVESFQKTLDVFEETLTGKFFGGQTVC
jgi:glutathione S-transferase